MEEIKDQEDIEEYWRNTYEKKTKNWKQSSSCFLFKYLFHTFYSILFSHIFSLYPLVKRVKRKKTEAEMVIYHI